MDWAWQKCDISPLLDFLRTGGSLAFLGDRGGVKGLEWLLLDATNEIQRRRSNRRHSSSRRCSIHGGPGGVHLQMICFRWLASPMANLWLANSLCLTYDTYVWHTTYHCSTPHGNLGNPFGKHMGTNQISWWWLCGTTLSTSLNDMCKKSQENPCVWLMTPSMIC